MLLQQDSHIWNKQSRNLEFVNSLRSLSDDKFIQALEDHDLYGIRFISEDVKRHAIKWYHKNDFYGISPNDVKMNYYINEVNALPDVKTVLEIGGGMGKLAKKLIDKGYEYTNVDITESLYCAKVYLRNKIDIEKKYTLIDIKDVESLYGKKFDVVINTHSLGEMSNNDVAFWMDFIQNKIKVKYFIGVNRFLNTVSDDEYSLFRMNENKASISFDNKWKVLDWEYSPLVLNCPYEDTRAGRCLKVVLLRMNKPDNSDLDINEIRLQDWYRYDPRVGTNLSSPFMVELGMGSTLFKLWNEIRINSNNEAVKLMIAYLDYLKKGNLEFEEKYAYQRMLNAN